MKPRFSTAPSALPRNRNQLKSLLGIETLVKGMTIEKERLNRNQLKSLLGIETSNVLIDLSESDRNQLKSLLGIETKHAST